MAANFNFVFKREIRPAKPHRLTKVHDGDTPTIDQAVRMVSADTPEKAGYAGLPPLAQTKLDVTAARLTDGTYGQLPNGLRAYLSARLTPTAAADHIAAGERATAEFDAMLERRLTHTTPTGRTSVRPVATIPTGEIIDQYGRLLAYLAPWFATGQLPPRGDPERRTFNLDMVAEGWAAPFVIYPSLPRDDDMNIFVDDARDAWQQKRGAWHEFGANLLLGYEYRMCVKLAGSNAANAVKDAFQRGCVDLRSMKDVGAYEWYSVPPPDRLWYWLTDKADAQRDLGFV